MIKYVARLESPQIILWCYLAWYLAIIVQYFDATPALWISSLGIAAIIGFALTLATRQKGNKADKWVIFRLYLFPFCVSSYSALIKGEGFILLFPAELYPLFWGVIACLIILGIHHICKRIYL